VCVGLADAGSIPATSTKHFIPRPAAPGGFFMRGGGGMAVIYFLIVALAVAGGNAESRRIEIIRGG